MTNMIAPAPDDRASVRDAALLLDMKEPVAPSPSSSADETDQSEVEPERDPETVTEPPRETRSILNAASDSSDSDDAVEKKKDDEDDDDDEDLVPPRHGERGVQYTLSELFVNPNLKCKSANAVLRKDPFAIPRADDNVSEYRPRFNPLSILVSEEKLLPGDFKFDFSEGIPGEPKSSAGKTLGKRGKEGRTSRSNSDFDASSLLVRKAPPPVRSTQAVFGDKLATMGLLMGSMPRQPQATPTPLINTPTVHNPFGEPLLELVVNDPPQTTEFVPLQRRRSATASESSYQPTYDSDVATPSASLQPASLAETFGAELESTLSTDLQNLSNLSKLSIAANNVAPAETHGPFQSTGYSLPPLTPPASTLYDGLSNYMPSHFAEKCGPPMMIDPAMYDVDAYSNEPDYPVHPEYGVPPASYAEYESQQRDYVESQSLQPVPKKPRSKNVFRPCTHPGCTKGARGKSGLCQKHGGGKRCATPNCPKGAQGSSKYCLFHGGGYRCTVPGCTTGARGTSGLCAKHGGYKRAREGGVDHHGEEGGAHEAHEGGSGPAEKKPRMEAYEGRALEASG